MWVRRMDPKTGDRHKLTLKPAGMVCRHAVNSVFSGCGALKKGCLEKLQMKHTHDTPTVNQVPSFMTGLPRFLRLRSHSTIMMEIFIASLVTMA